MLKYEEYPSILHNSKYIPQFFDNIKSILQLDKVS